MLLAVQVPVNEVTALKLKPENESIYVNAWLDIRPELLLFFFLFPQNGAIIEN